MILYRGTRYPEKSLRLRDYNAVFFATHKESAAEYGKFVSTFTSPNKRLVGAFTVRGRDLEYEFLGEQASKRQIYFLYYRPSVEWIRFLKSLGYDGVKISDYVGLFNVDGVRRTKTEVVS